MDRGFFFQRETLALYRQHAANAFGAGPDRETRISRAMVMDVAHTGESSYLEAAARIEVWADVIARARELAALRADHVSAARWEGIHRKLAARLRTRASIYRRGAPIELRLRGIGRLITDRAYTESWDGGLGRRAILKDAAVAITGIRR
jgi:hypothetical protein